METTLLGLVRERRGTIRTPDIRGHTRRQPDDHGL